MPSSALVLPVVVFIFIDAVLNFSWVQSLLSLEKPKTISYQIDAFNHTEGDRYISEKIITIKAHENHVNSKNERFHYHRYKTGFKTVGLYLRDKSLEGGLYAIYNRLYITYNPTIEGFIYLISFLRRFSNHNFFFCCISMKES